MFRSKGGLTTDHTFHVKISVQPSLTQTFDQFYQGMCLICAIKGQTSSNWLDKILISASSEFPWDHIQHLFNLKNFSTVNNFYVRQVLKGASESSLRDLSSGPTLL